MSEVECAKCGKIVTMPDTHVLPDGWERSMGDDYCPECFQTPKIPDQHKENIMADEPIPFLLLRLQVKAPRTGKWIDIWPAQFEQFQKLGCEIRIIELSPGDPAKYIVTEAMALAGARSIGNTIHTDNHLERARECWRAMWAASDGIMEPVPRERRP